MGLYRQIAGSYIGVPASFDVAQPDTDQSDEGAGGTTYFNPLYGLRPVTIDDSGPATTNDTGVVPPPTIGIPINPVFTPADGPDTDLGPHLTSGVPVLKTTPVVDFDPLHNTPIQGSDTDLPIVGPTGGTFKKEPIADASADAGTSDNVDILSLISLVGFFVTVLREKPLIGDNKNLAFAVSLGSLYLSFANK